VKKPRHLLPAPSLGSVDLSLDFDDGSTRRFTVTPTQASIVLLLVDAAGGGEAQYRSVDGALSLTQLASLAGLAEEEDVVHRTAAYWVTRGVLTRTVLSAADGMSRQAAAKAFGAANGNAMDVDAGDHPAYIDPFADEDDGANAGLCVLFAVDENQALKAVLDKKRSAKRGNAGATAAAEKEMAVAGAAEEEGEEDEEDEEEEEDDDDDDDDDDDAGAATAAAARKVEIAALATCEGYVKGVLSGHGSMELGRLHTMLKLLMAGQHGGSEDYKFDMTLLAFQRYLGGLVERDLLEVDAGVYRLRK